MVSSLCIVIFYTTCLTQGPQAKFNPWTTLSGSPCPVPPPPNKYIYYLNSFLSNNKLYIHDSMEQNNKKTQEKWKITYVLPLSNLV